MYGISIGKTPIDLFFTKVKGSVIQSFKIDRNRNILAVNMKLLSLEHIKDIADRFPSLLQRVFLFLTTA